MHASVTKQSLAQEFMGRPWTVAVLSGDSDLGQVSQRRWPTTTFVSPWRVRPRPGQLFAPRSSLAKERAPALAVPSNSDGQPRRLLSSFVAHQCRLPDAGFANSAHGRSESGEGIG